MAKQDEKHRVWVDYDVRVAMRDEVELSADIYRPACSKDGERFPAIVVRTPYNKVQAPLIASATYFAEQGYIYLLMDVRGRGDSDGVFTPYRNEAQDGYDTIEWCAEQGWCDGKVGTLGGSYLGHIQWLTALTRPPHLVTMISLVTPSDPFVESPTGTGGPMHICWLHLTAGRVSQNMEAVNWIPIYEHLPLMTMDEAAGRSNRVWREELEHTRLDEYWEPLCYQKRFGEIDLPAMHISGWYDDEQIGTPLNFAGMRGMATSERARQGQRLLMGPWGHAVNTSSQLGEIDFGAQSLIDLRGAELRWFDYWLKGKSNGTAEEAPVRIFVMGTNRWRDEQEWPLARTEFTRFYLHSGGRANSRFGDGRLSTEPPGKEEPDRYTYDPSRPTPFITEQTSSQIGGPDDYAAVERRDDVLVYMTAPLELETEITGPVRLELYAASSARDTDFTAKLVDVHPNGMAQRLCDGIVRARFREGMEHPSPIEPGRVYRYEIDLWNTCQVFGKGHRIGLEVASSAFPKYDRNLNTGEELAWGKEMRAAQQTILHDLEQPSALVLPVIPPSRAES